MQWIIEYRMKQKRIGDSFYKKIIMIYYKRNLPHYQPKGYSFFIITRLSGTIPRNIYLQIRNEFEKELEKLSSYQNEKEKKEKYIELQKYNFVKYENILDSCKFGYQWLGNKGVSNIVKNAIHFYENKKYNLIAYTIMPNHIHLVIQPLVERKSSSAHNVQYEKIPSENKSKLQKSEHAGDSFYRISKIMQDIKKYTAIEANKILNRAGSFWQTENYDHVIRDEKELRRIVTYVLNNPVKAGLCKTSDDWEWNYYNPKYFI